MAVDLESRTRATNKECFRGGRKHQAWLQKGLLRGVLWDWEDKVENQEEAVHVGEGAPNTDCARRSVVNLVKKMGIGLA